MVAVTFWSFRIDIGLKRATSHVGFALLFDCLPRGTEGWVFNSTVKQHMSLLDRTLQSNTGMSDC